MLPFGSSPAWSVALPPNTEILETLGEGSFGAVYVALISEGAIQRTVVLKVLKSEWAEHPEILIRSRDEAALLARLNHDNIVRVEQLTEIDGRPAVVMEHVQGLTLDRILKGVGPLPVSVAVAIAAKVSSALDAAFNQRPPGSREPLRVVHRDIKPSNIILSVSGGIKVLDFGTARAEFGERGAHTSALTLGSPLYMAPECFDGAEADPTVDMYALGATLYELIAGVPLGRLSVSPTKHAAKLEERLAALQPAEFPEGHPALRALRNLIGRCMRYEAKRRPTASDMRRLCSEFLKRLPRGTVTVDQYAQVSVEPLYNARELQEPAPLEATLGRSGLRDIDRSERASDAWSEADSAAKPQTEPKAEPAPPVSQPTPPAVRRRPEPVLPPTPEDEQGPGVGRFLLFGGLGIALGLAFAGGILMMMLKDKEPVPEPIQTPELQQVEEQIPAPAPADPTPPAPAADTIPADPPADEDTLAPHAAAEPAAPEPATEPEEPPPPPVELAETPREPIPERDIEPAPETEDAVMDPPVSVRVASVPAGATLRVGGISVQAPGSLELPAGQAVTVRVSFPNNSGGSCVLTPEADARWLFREDAGAVRCP